MFEEGNIVLFDPFYFSDGSSKKKFFVVLKETGGSVVIASLPTSKDHIPGDITLKRGCCEIPGRNVNAYVFLSGEEVAIRGDGCMFSFDVNTFVYGANVDQFDTAVFAAQHLSNKSRITTIGKIKDEIFDDLIHCLKNSSSVKRKIKRAL